MSLSKKLVCKFGLIAPVFFLVILHSSAVAKAGSSELKINEVYPNQLSDGIDFEWAELFSPESADVDLTDFELVKITSGGSEYRKQLSETICTNIDNYYVCNLGSGWLANSGATLVLQKNSVEIDRVIFGTLSGNAPVPIQGQSISRIPNGQDTDNNADDFQIVPLTKGFENISPAPITYSDKIKITEILPQPATGVADEFIELYNSSDADVDLKEWQLDAGIFSDVTIIKSKEYRVFKNSDVKIGLTDTGDTINLIDPNGETKSSLSYGKTSRGQSLSLFDSAWLWTTTLTPGLPNILTTETEVSYETDFIPTVDIKTARTMEDGETIKVSGTVTVTPSVLSNQYFYIQDDLSGIQIYSYSKDFPKLSSGDLISVTGELATSSNERRIKISNQSDLIILKQNSPPVPKIVEINQISEELEGMYIEFTGTISKTSGSIFYVKNAGEIEVVIRPLTGIKKPKMKQGYNVRVQGIVSQYQDHFRLLPISGDNVKILTSGLLPISGCDESRSNNFELKTWKFQLSQPMRRKRLVTNLAKI